MRKRIMPWIVFACTGLSAVAGDSPVQFGETRVAPHVVVQGGEVKVCIPFEPDAGWRYLAYRIIAYRPCVPTTCLKSCPWALAESKHGRKWDSFGIRKWIWLNAKAPKPTALEISLDTTSWPPGDYRLSAILLFRDSSQSGGESKTARDRYLSRSVHLSVLPAKP